MRFFFIPILLTVLATLTGNAQLPMDSLFKDGDVSDLIQRQQQSLKELGSGAKTINPINGSFSLQSQVNQVDSSASLGRSGVFTTVTGNVSTTLLGLPVQLQCRLGIRGSSIIRDISGIQLKFDASKYRQDKVAEKVRAAKDYDEYLSALPNMPTINKSDRDQLLNAGKADAVNGLLNHNEYWQERLKWQTALEYFNICLSDSICSQSDTAGYYKARQMLARYEQVSSYQDTLTVMRQRYDNRVRELEGVIQERKAQVKNFQWPSPFKPPISFTQKERFLSAIKAFDIGLFSKRISEYTLNAVPLKGMNYQFETRKIFGGIAFGKQNLSNGLSAWNYASIWDTLNSGRIAIAHFGLGDLSKNYIKVIMLHGVSSTALDSNSLYLPRQNRVLALEAGKRVSKSFSTKLEYATSSQNYFSKQIDETYSNSLLDQYSKSALSYDLIYSEPKVRKYSVSFGYFHVGPWFYSMGDPFLILNRNGLKTTAKVALFKRKLELDCRLSINLTQPDPNFKGSTARQTQFSGTARLNVKDVHIQIMASPNRFRYNALSASSDVRNNLFLLSISTNHKLARHKNAVAVSVSNIVSESIFADTTGFYQNTFTTLSNMFFINAKSHVHVKGIYSKTSEVDRNSFSIEALFTQKIQKFGLGSGLQYAKLPIDLKPKVGWRLDVRIMAAKSFSLTFQGLLRKDLQKNSSSIMEFIGNIGLTQRF
jgi:hypothetical protein